MTVVTLFLIAAGLFAPGILIIAYSKSGAQDTLGGVFVMFGVLFGLVAAAGWSLGL